MSTGEPTPGPERGDGAGNATEHGRLSRVDDHMTRIVLRPIASPLVLGFLALGGASVVFSGQQLHWYGAGQSSVVAVALMCFGFLLQSVASLFGFLARDVVTASAMGVLAASWLSLGLVTVLTAPGSTNPALGVLLVFAAVALLVPALAASFGKLVVALVLFTAALRFVLSGAYQLSAVPTLRTAAGIVGLVLSGVALYAALALGLEDLQRSTVLPVLRLGMGKTAMRGTPAEETAGLEHEAGVREQL